MQKKHRRQSSSTFIAPDGSPAVTPPQRSTPAQDATGWFARVSVVWVLLAPDALFHAAHADVASECARWLKVKSWQGTLSVKGAGSKVLDEYTTVTNKHSASGTFTLHSSGTTLESCISNQEIAWVGPHEVKVTVNDKYVSNCNPGAITNTITAANTPDTLPAKVLRFDLATGKYSFSVYSAANVHFGGTDCQGNTTVDMWGNWPVGPIPTSSTPPRPTESDTIPGAGTTLISFLPPIQAPGGLEVIPMTWNVNWYMAGNEETIPDSCQASGSIIGCENQSLGEDIEVVGAPFALHYRSDRAAGRLLASRVAVAHAQQIGGWTLGLHHAYDPALNTVYLGTGDKRDTAALGPVTRSASGQYLIASEGGDEVYVFDSAGRHRQTRDGLTGALRYQFAYDSQQRLISLADADGSVTRIERDASGQPTGILAPYGQHTLLTVDANGYLASVTDPAGHLTKLSTTASGLLTGFTNPRNKTSIFAYDGDGRLTSDQNAVGAVQTLARTEDAGKFTVTRTSGAGRTFGHEVAQHPAAGEDRIITDASGLKTTLTRDASGARTGTAPDGMQSSQTLGDDPRFGRSGGFPKSASLKTPGGRTRATTATRTAALSDPANPFSLTSLQDTATVNGKVYKSAYDAATRTLIETSPAGRTRTQTLDAKGRLIKTQRPGLWPVTYIYDAQGRLASQSQGPATAPRTVQFGYGADGFLATLTNPLGQKTSLTRDAAGQVTQEILPNGQAIGFDRDANGNPIAIAPPGRPSHGFAYSGIDLPTSYTAPLVGTEPNQTRYAYNPDRQLTQISRPDGKTVLLGYDAAGRLSTTKIARGTIAQAYDAVTGNLSSVTAPGGIGLAYGYDGALPTSVSWSGPVAGQVGFAYNNDFRTTAIRLNGGLVASYQYDADGLPVKAGGLTLAYQAGNGLLTGTALGLLLQDQWTYNGYAEPVDYKASFNGTPLYSTHYTRDKLGRVTRLEETVLGQTTQRTYQYGATGWLLKVGENGAVKASYTYDGNGNRLKAAQGGTTVAGSYDAQDRLTRYGSTTYAYTANGELTARNAGGQITGYQYDALGNLTGVALPNGTKIGYLIDGQNRRIGKKRNGALVKGFLYQDPLKPIAELNGAGQVVSRFVYATHANVPDLMIKGGVTYRIITDHLGSPRLVVNGSTGEVAQRMDYDEFGRVLTDTKPGFQPFGFAGGLYDSETRLVRFGARDYDAETGRWTAKDPVLFEGEQANLYAYVGNDPINRTDSFGLDDDWKGALKDLWEEKDLQKKLKKDLKKGLTEEGRLKQLKKIDASQKGILEYKKLLKDSEKTAKEEVVPWWKKLKNVWDRCTDALTGAEGSNDPSNPKPLPYSKPPMQRLSQWKGSDYD
jgi:RHS repeat-associated protein